MQRDSTLYFSLDGNYLAQHLICFDYFRELLAFEYLKLVCQHFESSPDLGNALVMHIELLLQKGKELLAKQKIQDIITGTLLKADSITIHFYVRKNDNLTMKQVLLCNKMTFLFTPTGHYTGKQMTPQALTSLHVMLWDQASKHFEVRKSRPCLFSKHIFCCLDMYYPILYYTTL